MNYRFSFVILLLSVFLGGANGRVFQPEALSAQPAGSAAKGQHPFVLGPVPAPLRDRWLDAVNTVDEEVTPVYDPIGNTLYFSRYSSRDMANVQVATYAIALNPQSAVVVPFATGEFPVSITMNGSHLWTAGNLQVGSARKLFLFKRTRVGDHWSLPSRVDISNLYTKSQTLEGIVTEDEKSVIFSLQHEDRRYLFQSNKINDTLYSDPKVIPGIHGNGDDVTPSLALGDSMLFFASNRTGTLGDFDLYYSLRTPDGAGWQPPQNFGGTINSPERELYIARVGRNLCFATSNHSKGGMDLAFLPVPEEVIAKEEKMSEAVTPATEVSPIIENVHVYFENNSTSISSGTAATLDKFVTLANAHSSLGVAIDGYTDSVGSIEYNLDLSRKRAQVVEKYVRSHGLRTKKFRTRWFGEAMPKIALTSLAVGDTKGGASAEEEASALGRRRVDLYFLPSK